MPKEWLGGTDSGAGAYYMFYKCIICITVTPQLERAERSSVWGARSNALLQVSLQKALSDDK